MTSTLVRGKYVICKITGTNSADVVSDGAVFQRDGEIVEVGGFYDLDKLEILPSEVAEDLPGGEWRRIQKSKGYNWILVNGEITFEEGEPTGAMPGKFLRNGRG